MKRAPLLWLIGGSLVMLRLAQLSNPTSMLPMQDTTFLNSLGKCPSAVISNLDIINSGASSPKGKPTYNFTITKPSVVSITTLDRDGNKKFENTLVTSSTSFGRPYQVVEIGCVQLDLDKAYNKAASTAPNQIQLKEETNEHFEKYYIYT
jgi:hypothetical protein